MGPRASLDTEVRGKILLPLLGIEPQLLPGRGNLHSVRGIKKVRAFYCFSLFYKKYTRTN
jgi:hypothetical protein